MTLINPLIATYKLFIECALLDGETKYLLVMPTVPCQGIVVLPLRITLHYSSMTTSETTLGLQLNGVTAELLLQIFCEIQVYPN